MFSLRTLLTAVAMAALASAALVYRTRPWASVMITMLVAVGVTVTVATWLSPNRRLFHAPFAFVIWLYLLVLFYPPLDELEHNLLTNQLIFRCWSSIAEEHPTPGYHGHHQWAYWQRYLGRSDNRGYSPDMTEWKYVEGLTALYHTVHCIAALLLGLVAGTITSAAYRDRTKP